MSQRIILASGSEIRQKLLKNAGVPFEVQIARVDEESIRNSLLADGASPRDVSDALAEQKARRMSQKNPEALIIGCDQILEVSGAILAKPKSVDEARAQLVHLRGSRHSLLSAVVVYEGGAPVWRHIGQVRLHMHSFSDSYLDAYLGRNWHSIQHSVGGYKLEEEGVRLFSKIEGDYFTVLGLPLLELLSYFSLRGVLEK